MIFNELNSLEYIESKNNKHSIGIDRLRVFLDKIGRPDEELSFIHIAGTNGKGSTSTFTASILAMSGKRVGLFTSPYFERFGERIRIIDGAEDCLNWKNDSSYGEINSDSLAESLNYLDQQCKDNGYDLDDFSHFETLVCLALIHFVSKKVEVVVWETGIGGRLDATNIIREANVVVLTSISYDHCDKLGSSIGEITREKVAIIKEQSKVILYNPKDSLISEEDSETVLKIVREKCKEKKVPLVIISSSDCSLISKSNDGQKFKISFYQHILHTSSLAKYQLQNIAVAIAAASTYDEKLLSAKSTLSEDPIVRAIAITKIMGRFELLNNNPEVILDAAHNPQAIDKFLNSLLETYDKRKIYFVFSSLDDKDYRASLDIILNKENLNLKKLILSQIDYFRATNIDDLYKVANELNDLKNNKNASKLEAEPEGLCSDKSNASSSLSDDMNSIFKILDIDINNDIKQDDYQEDGDILNNNLIDKYGLSSSDENLEIATFSHAHSFDENVKLENAQIETIDIKDKDCLSQLIQEARNERAIIVVSGSFYLISEFKKNFNRWFKNK